MVRIIVPVTGADSDERLLHVVERIAQRQRAAITLVFVVEVIQSMPLDAELPNEVERGERVLRLSRETIMRQMDVRKSSATTELLQARTAGAAIVDEAIDRNADMIMMGATLSRKHGKITVGETTEYVLKNAPCEVIIIRNHMPDWLVNSLGMEIT